MVAFSGGQAIFRHWQCTQQHSFRLSFFCLSAWMRRTKGSEQQILLISFNMPISSRFNQIFVFMCGKRTVSLTQAAARERQRANERAAAIEGTNEWVYFQEAQHQSIFNCFFSHSHAELCQNNMMMSLVFISVECKSIALHQSIRFTRATDQSIENNEPIFFSFQGQYHTEHCNKKTIISFSEQWNGIRRLFFVKKKEEENIQLTSFHIAVWLNFNFFYHSATFHRHFARNLCRSILEMRAAFHLLEFRETRLC